MLVGFLTLYIELAGLILTGGCIISSALAPMIMPSTVSSEQAIMLAMQ